LTEVLRFDLNADTPLNQMVLKSEQQARLAISISDSQLGDGRAIGFLCPCPGVIGLCAPFTFPFVGMSGNLYLMRLLPRASDYVTAGLVHGPPEDVDPLANMEESIPCATNLSMAWQPVWEEFSIGRSHDRMQLPCNGASEEESGQADNEIPALNVDLDAVQRF
jgi:hypothetical protein